jgi:protein SCO1
VKASSAQQDSFPLDGGRLGWGWNVTSPRVQSFARTLLRVLGAWALTCSAWAHESGPVNKLDFIPPAPGSYKLERIMPVPDGHVLDLDGKRKPLAQFTRDKITLLGFIYTSCVDANGCPMAYEVFSALKQALAAKPALHDKVRLVSLSFDPLRDTPEVMKSYGGSQVKNTKGVPWYFLTTKSKQDLLPLVEGFGQDVEVAVDEKTGRVSRTLSHVLKVFLIDRAGQTREIYTTSFLIPQVVLNDVETLLMEDMGATKAAAQ